MLEAIYGGWRDPMQLLYLQRNLTMHFRVQAPEIKAENRDVYYSRDGWGLRGEYGRPGDIDILTVGGSTTDQLYVTDGKTWQDVLQERFKAAGKDIRVANAGVSGRTTFGHLEDFRLWFPNIEGLKPRYVLFYVGINDMFFDNPGRKRDRVDRAHIRDTDIKQWIRENSATYYVYRTLIGLYGARKNDLTRTSLDFRNGTWTGEPVRSDYAEVLQPRLEGFRDRLHRLAEIVVRWGAVPVFVTQSRGDYLLQDGGVLGLVETKSRAEENHRDGLLGVMNRDAANGVDYYLMLRLFNHVTLEVCRDVGGICIDLFGELEFSIGDFYDHVHNTVSGSARIGGYLFSKLNDQME